MILNPMEQRLVEDAKSNGEAERLRDLFILRKTIIRRYLCFLAALPFLSIIFALIVFGNMADNSQQLPVEDDYVAGWDKDDPKLIEHIRRYYLYQPAAKSEPYNLLWPAKKDWSHKGQSLVVDGLLGGKRDGFFFEAGAYDGETYSNSLYFEKYLNWSGVMVEPDMGNIRKFKSKKRKCFLVRGCIGTANTPQKVTFYGAMETGTTAEHMNSARYWFTRFWRPVAKFDTWCWPLNSILKAVNHTRVDYMVLDIEGNEMGVMKAADWSQIDTDVIQVEYMIFAGIHWDKDKSQANLKEMREYFLREQKDFAEHSRIFLDLIYVKKKLLGSSHKGPLEIDNPDK